MDPNSALCHDRHQNVGSAWIWPGGWLPEVYTQTWPPKVCKESRCCCVHQRHRENTTLRWGSLLEVWYIMTVVDLKATLSLHGDMEDRRNGIVDFFLILFVSICSPTAMMKRQAPWTVATHEQLRQISLEWVTRSTQLFIATVLWSLNLQAYIFRIVYKLDYLQFHSPLITHILFSSHLQDTCIFSMNTCSTSTVTATGRSCASWGPTPFSTANQPTQNTQTYRHRKMQHTAI